MMHRKVLHILLGTLCFVVIDAGGPIVRTEILSGVVQTGIGQYGTYLVSNPPLVVNVSCVTSELPLEAEIILLENNVETGKSARANLGAIYQALFPSNILSTGITQFTCRLRITTPPEPNRGSLVYEVEDSVELDVWSILSGPRCVSSIGNSGTEKETTTATCIKPVNSRTTEIRWRGPGQDTQWSDGTLLGTHRELSLSQITDELVCEFRESDQLQWSNACTLPPLTILPDLSIEILPSQFHPDVDSLSFTCQTWPHDRIKWFVYGDYGDVLNVEDVTTFLLPQSKVNVAITQKGGESTLQLLGPPMPFLGIHTVMCVNSERLYFRIAISQAQSSGTLTNRPSLTVPTDTSSVAQTTNSHVIMTCDDKRRTGFSPTSIVFNVILALLVIILGGVCVFLYLRTKSPFNHVKPPDVETSAPIRDGNTQYEKYNSAHDTPSSYTELQPAGNENLLDTTPSREDGYEIPKP